MNDNPCLLEGIFAAPDDDLPRLIYADWLEDHGQTQRAAFIRAQIAEDRYWVPDPHGSPLRGRVHTLLVPEVRPFVLDPRLIGGAGQNPEDEDGESPLVFHYFRRGFIEAVEVLGKPAVEWLGRQAELLFRSHPVLALGFLRPPYVLGSLIEEDTFYRFLSLPAIGRLRHLDLRQQLLNDELVEVLLASALPPFTQLTVNGSGLSKKIRRKVGCRFSHVEILDIYLEDPDNDIPF